ncbi:MAG TPA: tetratricopeptide repeat protein [Povalibacter sp.]|nr:tetratricopeptide repeat protein [Povalibacter sp.]
MKALIAFSLLLCAATGAQASSWSDLWLNRDQQGQRLLEAGKADEAARTFADAKHRAYAQIQAGAYDDAAKQLQAFDDPESHYNRGNALARGGKLKEALSAYDRAIEQAPVDSALRRDARHNRDLVAQQLKKQSPQSSSAKAGNQSQPSGNGSASQQQQSGQSGSRASDASADGKSAGGSQAQSAQANAKPDSQGQSQAQQQASAQPGADSNSATQSQSDSKKQSQDAAQAQRDAQASLAQQQQGDTAQRLPAAGHVAPGEHDKNANQAADAVEPPSEQTLALDQWLRQIPDDPSGLLRRKFLIEHLRRQRESQ